MNLCIKCGTANQIDVKYKNEQVWKHNKNTGLSEAVFEKTNTGIVQPKMQDYLQKTCRICGYLWQEECLDNKPINDSKQKRKEHIMD